MITQQMRQAIVNYMATQPIKKAWVFGSFARDEETPESDVDLRPAAAVTANKDKKVIYERTY